MDSEIIIYQTDDGLTKVETRLQDETIWLTQQQLADLYHTTRANITMHIKNIFSSGELDEKVVCQDFLHTTKHGAISDKSQTKPVKSYNLDMIISLGYRINSKVATAFRQWATRRLNEYIRKGFTMDDERLKASGGGGYWQELLNRIRDIRSSEKALYRQVLDLYATSMDYDPHSEESAAFFKTVQNKLHYAVNQQTAAEVINSRAGADKDFMGLTSFRGSLPVLDEVRIAKNYLTEDELFRLNRLVSAFFDLAEIKAVEHQPMRMRDWVAELDKFVKAYGRGVLSGKGKISHQQAIKKAEGEYRKYQVRMLSEVEKAYLEELKKVEKIAENGGSK